MAILVSPNGVRVDAGEQAAARLLSNGFRPEGGKPDDKPAPAKRAAKKE